MTYRWNSSLRCQNPDHHRSRNAFAGSIHSSLVSLHALECEAIDNGLADYKITDENIVPLARKIVDAAIAMGYKVQAWYLPALVIQDLPDKIFGDCSYREKRIRLNTRTGGDRLETLVHELAHWVVNADAFQRRIPVRRSHGKQFKDVLQKLYAVAAPIATPAREYVIFVTKENARRILGYDKINAIHTLAWRGDVEQVKVEGFRGKVITLASLEAHMAAKGIDRKRIRMATVYEAMRAA